MEKFNFDEAMKRLAVISETLSQDDLEMDKALALFEEGLSLSAQCQQKLKEYETKVNELVIKHQGDQNV